MAKPDRTRGIHRRGARAAALLAAALAFPAGTAWTQSMPEAPPAEPVATGMDAEAPGTPERGPIELHGDEPLAQYLILRFMKGHPDLFWRIRGREFYARGDYPRARECFERAARFADKPSQAMLGEMHWSGRGGAQDRALAYAWMDLAAERYYEDFYILRERYWAKLDMAEREQALLRGQALLRKYGDDKAKRRLAKVLVRERPDKLAVGGFFGNLPIIPPSGAGRE